MTATVVEDLSLHILDIVENSIAAGASCVEITIREDLATDRLEVEIADDGQGMNAEMKEKALSPFFTSKTVRRVGLGLPLFREAARRAGGELTVTSQPGQGTCVKAVFQHSHLDRQPLGDLAKTLTTLIIGNHNVRFVYMHHSDDKCFALDTDDFEELRNREGMGALKVGRLLRTILHEHRRLS